MKTIVTGLLVLLLPLWVAAADKNEVRVVDAWARAVPAVAPVAGGFLTVVNMGDNCNISYIFTLCLHKFIHSFFICLKFTHICNFLILSQKMKFTR